MKQLLILLGLMVIVSSCVFPRVSIQSMHNSTNDYKIQCFQNIEYCHQASKEICSNGYKIYKVTTKKKTSTWYTRENCGASSERRVFGRFTIESGCHSNTQFYEKKNTFSYDVFNMIITCK